ncbi:MAG: undecaprenyl-phosphate glucose phosphotransferase [Gammaproteobacteria bacterium]
MSSRLERNFSEAVAIAPTFADASSPASFGRPRHRLPFHLIAPVTAASDVAVITLASLIAGVGYHWLAFDGFGDIREFLALGVLVSANFTALTMARQNYRPMNLINIGRQVRFATLNWLFIFAILTMVAFTLKVSTNFSRGVTLSFLALGLAGLTASRILVGRNLKRALANGAFAEQRVVLITENGQEASSRALAELRHCGYRPVRTFGLSATEVDAAGATKSIDKKMREIITTCQNDSIDYVFLLTKWNRPRLIENIVRMLRVLPTPVHLLPDENVGAFLAARQANIGTTLTVELQRAPLTKAERRLKRVFDTICATILLVLLSPVLLLTAALIKIDSKGPVLFKQRRNGFNGSTFFIYKFRSMGVLEDGETIKQATQKDPRVTRIGRWLRQTSIDELPQLLNVLRGEMSLVGPRPHAVAHNTEYQDIVANYAFRHHVKPGITGWAQINGYRGETQTVDSMAKRVEHDLWYINHWSFWLDLRILLKTLLLAYRQPMAY